MSKIYIENLFIFSVFKRYLNILLKIEYFYNGVVIRDGIYRFVGEW